MIDVVYYGGALLIGFLIGTSFSGIQNEHRMRKTAFWLVLRLLDDFDRELSDVEIAETVLSKTMGLIKMKAHEIFSILNVQRTLGLVQISSQKGDLWRTYYYITTTGRQKLHERTGDLP